MRFLNLSVKSFFYILTGYSCVFLQIALISSYFVFSFVFCGEAWVILPIFFFPSLFISLYLVNLRSI